jgi:hypothetical protein
MILMLSELIQITIFILGTLLLICAGKQDEKTRNPYILIPALMCLGLSAGFLTFVLITIASLIIFFLKEKVNKIIGKADLLLFYSLLVIIMLNQNLLLTQILFMSLTLTLIMLIVQKHKEKQMPLIYYYAQAYALSVLITITIDIGVLIGVFLYGF